MTVTRREHFLPALSSPIGHCTHAVSFGDLLFVSGLVGVRDGILERGVVAQARGIFGNLSEVLASVDASFADVLKVSVYLVCVDDRTAIDPVRSEFFGAHRPASTLVQISRLARPDALVEVDTVVGLSQR